MNIFFEIHSENLREGPGSIKSTKRALSFLKDLPSNPQILDVGCGPGQQSLDLLRFTDGLITSVDNHQLYLDSLNIKVIDRGFEDRITILNRDMSNLNFEPNSFDLLWSEGAIYNIGFEKGLKLWKPLVRLKGYIAVTEISWLKDNLPKDLREFWEEEYPEITTVTANIDTIKKCGLKLVNHFTLPESDWWNYYNPITIKLELLKEKYKNNCDALEVINLEYKEIELYRNYCDYYGYVFYILQNY